MNQYDTPEIPLLAYDAALDELISHLSTVPGVSEKPLMQALGAVLAETQQASINVPSADNSAMDEAIMQKCRWFMTAFGCRVCVSALPISRLSSLNAASIFHLAP